VFSENGRYIDMSMVRLYLRHIAQELGAMDEFKALASLALPEENTKAGRVAAKGAKLH
jgi:hypothetical protein